VNAHDGERDRPERGDPGSGAVGVYDRPAGSGGRRRPFRSAVIAMLVVAAAVAAYLLVTGP
jgi:hypothetical protein